MPSKSMYARRLPYLIVLAVLDSYSQLFSTRSILSILGTVYKLAALRFRASFLRGKLAGKICLQLFDK